VIDVHNYLRKVSIHAPEGRKTARWEMRFFMQLLAGHLHGGRVPGVQAALPQQGHVYQDDFVLDVIGEWLDNMFGVAGGLFLRALPADDEPASSRALCMHDMRQLLGTEHFTANRAAQERPTRSATLRCRTCRT
jgi:hypothetical protein